MQDVTGKNLLKVEPLNAILDPQYFVRAVHQCTLSILHGREKEANLQAIAGYSILCCLCILTQCTWTSKLQPAHTCYGVMGVRLAMMR